MPLPTVYVAVAQRHCIQCGIRSAATKFHVHGNTIYEVPAAELAPPNKPAAAIAVRDGGRTVLGRGR